MHDDYKDIIDIKYQKSKQFPPMSREKKSGTICSIFSTKWL